VKINVGCGSKRLPGYVNVDINPAYGPDYACHADRLGFCGDGQAEEILLEAVYEHLYLTERPRALAEWRRCLCSGGRLVINWLPDAEAAAMRLSRHIRGECGADCGTRDEFPHFNLEVFERFACAPPQTHHELAYNVHKGLFTREVVRQELEAAGFHIASIEGRTYPGEHGSPVNLCIEAVKV